MDEDHAEFELDLDDEAMCLIQSDPQDAESTNKQELHLVCDPKPGQEVPSTQIELEADAPQWNEEDASTGIAVEEDEVEEEEEEDAPHAIVETISTIGEHLSTDVLVFSAITWLFYGPASPLAWFALGVEMIMVSMVMAGIAIVPIFLVSPLLAFPVCFVVTIVYRKVKRKENPGTLPLIVALILWAVFWLQALLLYLWANGILPLWAVLLTDGILAMLASGAFFFYEVKRRQRTRSFVRVTTTNTHETVYCKDVYDEEADGGHNVEYHHDTEEEEEEEYDAIEADTGDHQDLFEAPAQQQQQPGATSQRFTSNPASRKHAW